MGLSGDKTWTLGRLGALEAARERASSDNRLGQLFQELHQALYGYLVLLLWNPTESEELMQEAFLRLHRELQNGTVVDDVKAWLFRVGHNLAIDYSRRRKPTESLSSNSVTQEVERGHTEAISTPESLLLDDEQHAAFLNAVGQLSATQKSCLLLRAEGFRYGEIAKVLGLSESAVGESVRRGIRRLSKELHVRS